MEFELGRKWLWAPTGPPVGLIANMSLLSEVKDTPRTSRSSSRTYGNPSTVITKADILNGGIGKPSLQFIPKN